MKKVLMLASIAVTTAALMGTAAGVAAWLDTRNGDDPPQIVKRIVAQTKPLKQPVEAASRAVGRAVTTVRQVPDLVDRPPRVPAGQIRPCTEGHFVVDFEQMIYENALNQFLGGVGGAAPDTPADAVVAFTLPTFYQLIGAADGAASESAETTEETLRLFVRDRLIGLILDEAEDCPELVERVVTTVITELRPEESKEGTAAVGRY